MNWRKTWSYNGLLCHNSQFIYEILGGAVSGVRPTKPVLWEVHVSDIFCILKRETEEALLNHLNNQPHNQVHHGVVVRDGRLLDSLLRRRGDDGVLDSSQ